MRFVLMILFLVSSTLSLHAKDIKTPSGPVVLTVSGNLGVTNADDTAVFDLDMLKALPQTNYETSTIWTEGVQEFSGVSLVHLADLLQMSGNRLKASAINDYHVEIPMTDAVDGGPIVAYAKNGSQMSVREKGPLWVIYPFDSDPKYQTELTYSRSIWQLDRLEVLD